MKTILILLALIITPIAAAPKTIHLFVALCDNESQGIAPVGKKIGNGDDPANNLYWGCTDGARSYFTKSKQWTRLEIQTPENSPILQRIIFKHKATGTILIADAYRGSKIKTCTLHYLQSIQGNHTPEITTKLQKSPLQAGSKADLIAYIGHNGLMDFKIEQPTHNPNPPKIDTITLCCISKSYFPAHFTKNTNPILQTKSLMYPGAFILHDALEGYLKNETKTQIYNRAATAYAKNQKISKRAAKTIFQTPN